MLLYIQSKNFFPRVKKFLSKDQQEIFELAELQFTTFSFAVGG